MSAPELTILSVAVKAQPVYSCVDCGAHEPGQTAKLELTGPLRPREVGDALAQATDISNWHMPVGWAGYGTQEHRCPRCAK